MYKQGSLPYEIAKNLLDGYEFMPQFSFKSDGQKILLQLRGSAGPHLSKAYMQVIHENTGKKYGAYGRYIQQHYLLLISYDGICLSET